MRHSSARFFRLSLLSGSLVGAFITGGLSTQAFAADLPTAAPPAPPPVLATDWWASVTHTVQAEAGISVNPDNPGNHNNFGQLFSDKPNEPLFNQLLITFARPVDASKPWDIGFNFQVLFGSDARYDPTLGLLDYTMRGRVQFAPTQANVVIHTPGPTAGGADTKIGLIPGAMGYEGLDPSARPFYTFSWTSNYLLPFETFGALTTWHINPTIDIYTGVDAGNETTPWRDNNSSPAGYVGFGLNNLMDNKLTVLAVSRIGPEDASRGFPGTNVNTKMRYWNDVTLTYKATDKWTFVGEGNYFRDELLGSAYGFVGYASYAFNDQVTANVRGEIYRDNSAGLITVGYLSNTAFTSGLYGNADQFYSFGAPLTIGSITGGLSIKPTWLNTIQNIGKFTIRPEVRYDASLNNTKPFNSNGVGPGPNNKSGQFLFSTDVIFAF